MANSLLSAEHFHDEPAALAFIEARLWPNGPVCPRCKETVRVGRMNGQSTKLGLCKCYVCRKPFAVTVGTVMESSHIPLHKWLQAMHLICASKKGISSNELSRVLSLTVKSAWFMSHRIREAMRSGTLEPMGGAGVPVEADETYIGRKEGRQKAKAGYGHKRPVLSLVERGGKVRSFHVPQATVANVAPIVASNIARESCLMTDESRLYWSVGTKFADHQAVQHGKDEYVRGDVHTNTVEGYFSIFKRGMTGIYQHCSEKHLHRYVAEYDFRYNTRIRLGVNDTQRAEQALMGVVGKRLTYRTIGQGVAR